MSSEFFNTKELADYIGSSMGFVRKHITSGRLPGMIRAGRFIKFRKSDVEKRLLSGQLLLDRK